MKELNITVSEREKFMHEGFKVYSDATLECIEEGIRTASDLLSLVCYGERMRGIATIYGFEGSALEAYERALQSHADMLPDWTAIFDAMHAHLDDLRKVAGREKDWELRELQELDQAEQVRCLIETFCIALAKSRVTGDYEDITCMSQYAHETVQDLILMQNVHDRCWAHTMLDLACPVAFAWLDSLGELSMQKAMLDVYLKR